MVANQREKRYESWFDSAENRALLAICARRQIKATGVGAVFWGLVNLAQGYVVLFVLDGEGVAKVLGFGPLILGIMMLSTGIQALRRPTISVLRAEMAVSVCLFVWNLAVTVIEPGQGTVQGLVWPLAAAFFFSDQYRRLRHVADLIAAVEPDRIKAVECLQKRLWKQKLRKTAYVLQSTNGRCRVHLQDHGALFVQRDLKRAFVVPRDALQESAVKPKARSWRLKFRHPLGPLAYVLSRKNTDKVKAWLERGEPSEDPDESTPLPAEQSEVEQAPVDREDSADRGVRSMRQRRGSQVGQV